MDPADADFRSGAARFVEASIAAGEDAPTAAAPTAAAPTAAAGTEARRKTARRRKAAKGIGWTDAAMGAANSAMHEWFKELHAEAERIAARAQAGAVGPEYVSRAAARLGYRENARRLAIVDAVMSLAWFLFGTATALLIAYRTAADPKHIVWMLWAAIYLAAAGGICLGWSLAIKLRRPG